MTNPPLRFGILGAARIAPMALVRPAREGTGVEVVAVAARDERRARAFARRHRIPRTHGSYAALLADPEVDAVYVSLPNSRRSGWMWASRWTGARNWTTDAPWPRPERKSLPT